MARRLWGPTRRLYRRSHRRTSRRYRARVSGPLPSAASRSTRGYPLAWGWPEGQVANIAVAVVGAYGGAGAAVLWWAMGVESGARASRTLSGELSARPLAVLVAGGCERGTTGTFTFTHGARRDTLTLRLGKIAVVRTSEPMAYLGDILRELGAIDEVTRDATLLEVTDAGRLHGDALVASGALSRERVEEGLAEQTLRGFTHLFSLPEATKWTFREDVDELVAARDEGRPLVDTWPAIWRALRSAPTAAHVPFILAKIEGAVQVKDLGSVARFALSPEELAFCKRLHARPSSLATLRSSAAATGELPVAKVDLLVYLLALGRCITRVETPPVGPLDLGVEGVRERARRITDEAPHVVLGISRGASIEAARAAFFRLARLWHPDKQPPALDAVRNECRYVYTRMGEAHRSLVDTVSHADVDAMLGRTNGASAANDSARTPPFVASIRDADAALARGDIDGAKAIARNLTSTGGSGPGARAILAWCAIGGNADAAGPHALEAAMVALDRVLTGDPDCVRALFFRAQVHKRLGNELAALRDHRRVTRLDPGHALARHEMSISPIKPTPSLFPSMMPSRGGASVAPPAMCIPLAPRMPRRT